MIVILNNFFGITFVFISNNNYIIKIKKHEEIISTNVILSNYSTDFCTG